MKDDNDDKMLYMHKTHKVHYDGTKYVDSYGYERPKTRLNVALDLLLINGMLMLLKQ
jgi:hypothetical protein